MEHQLLDLELYIANLKKINNLILYDIRMESTDKLEKERSVCISKINAQCNYIRPNLTDQFRLKFVDMIKGYLTIQEDYTHTKKDLFTTQLLMRNPNLTKSDLDTYIENGQTDILSLANENFACIKSRHNSILKSEHSIEEIRELVIKTHAITENHGKPIIFGN